MRKTGKTPKRSTAAGNETGPEFIPDQFQGRGYHGSQGNMDIYAENEGYFGSLSPFYGDLPEEKVDTQAIDKEFEDRYGRLLKIATKVLTADQYRIFELYFIKTKTQAEIAKLLGTSQPYITKTCARILEILRMHEGEVL